MSINNLYHFICHSFIHTDFEENLQALKDSYKGVFFILQNIYYLKNNKYIQTKKELLSLLDGIDYDILKRSIDLKNGIEFDFGECFELLFKWCQKTIKQI